ncbi:MAG TPA: hypothetical protein PLK06_02160 [bacterium]|nr:hypothetical protein [bacterium]
MKPLLTLALVSAIFFPLKSALAFDPNFILSDEELQDSQAMDLNQIQAFLERGGLADLRLEDHTGRTRDAADIIWRTAQQTHINPKFLLVLLQKEQSLIEDEDPTQKQLDWAAGYAVCDHCSMNDPLLSRWKGFGKQVNSAALQFIDGYLQDIYTHGKTAGKYGPGVPVVIDGETVVPVNAATAAMYAYTPHLHGNQNFVAIWNRWFGREYPSGSLLQAAGQDGVWLIQRGYRRPIMSASVLSSRFNADLIIPVSATVLEQFPIGTPISFPNYSLLREENGKISLLVDDTLRHIDSMETFNKIGFSEDELVSITSEEAANFTEGDPITLTTTHPQGILLQIKDSGAVFYIENGQRHAIFDKSILEARFPNATLTPAQPVDIEQYSEGTPLLLPEGYLVRGVSEPAVYVISDGKRLPIQTESVFLGYGYKWENVHTVPDDILALQPLGEALADAAE